MSLYIEIFICVLQKKVEVLWAIQAHDHAEVYFNVSLLKKIFF